MISISEVRMSPDLKIATAFVSPLGAKDNDAVIEALNTQREIHSRPRVRRCGR